MDKRLSGVTPNTSHNVVGRHHVLLLTGIPGIGKTTLIRRVAALLGARSLRGFYTEEIRERGERQGFRLVSFAGMERVIAHVSFPKRHRVGKYGVDVDAVDEAAGELLRANEDAELFLVDEIGKMECLSSRFVSVINEILAGDKPVIATIARKGSGLIADAKARSDSDLWEVTRENRDRLPDRVMDWIAATGRRYIETNRPD